MPTAYTTLTLTGGAATRNLVDGVNYSLVTDGYAPAVPGLRRSRLAGGGPYDDAAEEILINALGVDGPTAHANLLALADDLDQAVRWRQEEEVSPILLNLQPQGSNLAAPLSVPIWGGSVPLGLPATYNDHLMIYEIGPVALRFRRPGQWLGAAETPGTTLAQTHPNVFSVTFASDVGKRLLPLKLALSGFEGSRDSGGNDLGSAAYLVVASHSNKIRKVEAEACAASAPGSGTFATAADSNASGGSIRRLVPNSLGDYTLLHTASPSLTGRSLYTVLAVVKNNSSSITYRAKFGIRNSVTPGSTLAESPEVVIDASTTLPRVIQFGPVASEGTRDEVVLTFSPSATGSSQLDVDVFILLQIVDPTDRIVALTNINKAWLSGLGPQSLTLDPAVLTRPLPLVTQATGAAHEYKVSHRGDIYLLTTGDRVAACLVGTTEALWRIVNGQIGSGPTAVSSAMTATRRLAYRVPQ